LPQAQRLVSEATPTTARAFERLIYDDEFERVLCGCLVTADLSSQKALAVRQHYYRLEFETDSD